LLNKNLSLRLYDDMIHHFSFNNLTRTQNILLKISIWQNEKSLTFFDNSKSIFWVLIKHEEPWSQDTHDLCRKFSFHKLWDTPIATGEHPLSNTWETPFKPLSNPSEKSNMYEGFERGFPCGYGGVPQLFTGLFLSNIVKIHIMVFLWFINIRISVCYDSQIKGSTITDEWKCKRSLYLITNAINLYIWLQTQTNHSIHHSMCNSNSNFIIIQTQTL
jgi:hypothetical protein